VIVPGGPAERDGTVRPGDIILAVDGVPCSSIGEVIAVLSSPAASVKNPLSVQLLRKAKFAVADDLLLVRARHASAAADGLEGLTGSGTGGSTRQQYGNTKSGGLHLLSEWTQCRCALMSDRRLCIRETSQGIDAAFDLRATQSVQLVLTQTDKVVSSDAGSRSCLQVRTPDGLIEFCAPDPTNGEPSVLLAWQHPLEDMLMVSLSSALKGWMHYLEVLNGELSSVKTSNSRIFLDLNHHSQMRTVVDTKGGDRSSKVGVIELVELQQIELVELPAPLNGAVRDVSHALRISTAETACMLACEDDARARMWATELETAHKAALVALVQYTGMILIDGWLEYQGDEDEWAQGFFLLTIGSGLQCFEDAVTEPTAAEAIETLPLGNITGAVRSKGIDYYDWCIDVRTTDGDYIRVRPPRQAEMTRWLATINLYCTPPPKKKPDRPKRRSDKNDKPSASIKSAQETFAAANSGCTTSSPTNRPTNPRGRLSAFSFTLEDGMVQLPVAANAAVQAWGGAGAAAEEGPRSPRLRAMTVPPADPQQAPGQYPGLLAGWLQAPGGVETEPRQLSRANSFGRRGRTMSFGRKPRAAAEAESVELPRRPAPESSYVEPPTAVAAPGPSRGGRLRSAKPTGEAAAHAPAEAAGTGPPRML